MVGIDMALEKLSVKKMEEIKMADQKQIIPYLRRRKYKLFAAFFSASMIHPNDGLVEFEVSIGITMQFVVGTCLLPLSIPCLCAVCVMYR